MLTGRLGTEPHRSFHNGRSIIYRAPFQTRLTRVLVSEKFALPAEPNLKHKVLVFQKLALGRLRPCDKNDTYLTPLNPAASNGPGTLLASPPEAYLLMA